MAIKPFPKQTLTIAPDVSTVENTAQRILFVGQMVSGGTATAGDLNTEIGNDNSWDTLFGANSMLAGMIRTARDITSLAEKQVRIDAIALDDATGTPAAGEIDFTGTTATAAGTFIISIGSKEDYQFTLDVASGDAIDDIGTAFEALVNANTEIPVTALNSTGTVTLTFDNDGTVGNSIGILVEGTVAGIVPAVTAFTSGATDPTLTNVLDVVGQLRYQLLVYPAEYGFDFGAKDFLDPRFNAVNKIVDGVAVLSQTDTLSAQKSAGAAENSQSLVVNANKIIDDTLYKGSSVFEIDYIIAAQMAAEMAVRLQSGSELSQFLIGQFPADLIGGVHNASLPLANTAMPLISVIDETKHWTADEIDELNTAGMSVLDNNAAINGVLMNQILTTYKTDIAGNPDTTYKFKNYVDTISNVREYQFNNFKKKFAQYRLDDTSEQEIRNWYIGTYRTLSSASFRLLRSGQTSFDFYRNNLSVTVDFSTGLITTVQRLPIQTQLRELVATLKVTFDVSTGQPVAVEESIEE